MKQLTLSIVIPAYNEEMHLERCLQAIAAQTTMPDEVIVVDNNSTDQTVKIARQFPFVKVVQESRQGVLYARNAGFEAARSDIIGRIDADTLLPPDWVAHLVRFYSAEAHRRYAWVGPCRFYNLPLPWLTSFLMRPIGFGINRIVVGTNTLFGSNMALLRTQWQEVVANLCLRPDIHEDLDLAIHLHQAGYKTYFDRHMVVPAAMRSLHLRGRALWRYLQMWPRTLRVHGFAGWVLAEVTGVGLIYALFPIYVAVDWLGRRARQVQPPQ
ncbi:MAG TPA: glycosyltransferase family 2 protein [Candidatus Saccharimonadales bacterium]|nr:glycosyltransferase family 2 protein [Candidatus Saccharimonadales bacterium]